MTVPPVYRRRATARDLHFFTHPELWPCRPFLPVTRLTVDGTECECGLLYDARGVSQRYGLSATVFVGNLCLLPPTETEFLALPKHVYDTVEELAADGWAVD